MLIKHPRRLAGPAEWPNFWPFTLNLDNPLARNLMLWMPCDPNAPFYSDGLLKDKPPTSIAGDPTTVGFTTPFVGGQASLYPTPYSCTSLWAFVGTTAPDGWNAVYTITTDYGLAYDSPNFDLYPSTASVHCFMHHTWDHLNSGNNALRLNEWNHIVFIQRAGWADGLRLYVNGKRLAWGGVQYGTPLGMRNTVYLGLRDINAPWIRDVRFMCNHYGFAGEVWSDDEVLQQYENPFDIYDRVGRRLYFSVSCPSSVTVSGAWKVA